MELSSDLRWESDVERIVLSPRSGGRIVSWRRQSRELVLAPILLEGGLLRILFAEEQYPGSSFTVPHRVLERNMGPDGFRIRLRHFWNASNAFMRAAGWPEKANALHLDGLVLDKLVTYEAGRSCLICELTIANTTPETKYLTPWVHLSYAPWPADRWVVLDGKRAAYAETDIYWGAHLARSDRPMRLVHAAEGDFFAVFGAATDHLKGMSSRLPIPGEFHQSTGELRYATIELGPGQQWRANSFLALTDDWTRWSEHSPADLYSRIEPSTDGQQHAEPTMELLGNWLLPAERDRGLMVLSFLDKPPFSSASRYAAADAFAGFHACDGRAEAWVMLYAARDLPEVRIELTGDAHWNLRAGEGALARETSIALKRHDFVRLVLQGPVDLKGKESVTVTLNLPDDQQVELRVPEEAVVEPRYAYQVLQMPAYLEDRFNEKRGVAPDAAPETLRAWQGRVRERYRQWLDFNAAGRCDPEARRVERQEGPHCVREKWLIQTEPGMWVPGYLIRPKDLSGRGPLLYFLHGSGPGKDGFAGDEEAAAQTQLGHELEYMPYRLARELSCHVYVPDGRGQGEMGETNTSIWSARLDAMGISNAALRVLDQVRALDWLVERTDVDPARVGSLGCSGGGGMTYLLAAADERVAAAIVSSTAGPSPLRPLPAGYFHRMFAEETMDIDPPGIQPVAGAPTGMLIAPRPLWILDGLDDLGIEKSERDQWRNAMQEGRDSIRSAYRILGAEDRFRDTWLEGGHCAGMTVANVVVWFRTWFESAGR